MSGKLEMILVNTNRARNSKSTIEAVMRLRDSDNERFKSLMDEIGSVTYKVIEMYRGDEHLGVVDELLGLISRNHVLLRDLGVSCQEIETIVETLDT